MNKKISTLAATLLIAGAGMTLNAEVVKVKAPKVGGSYLIGLSATEGVGDKGTVGGLLQIAEGDTTLTASADAAAAYLSVGGEWTLADAKIEGKKAFYLVKDGKYICAADTVDRSLAVSADETKKDIRIAFEMIGDTMHVAKAVGKIIVGDELSIAATVVKVDSTGTGTALVFATYQADKEVTFGTEKPKLVATPVKDTYYFIAAMDKKLLYLAEKDSAVKVADASSAKADSVAHYLWKVTESTVGTTTQYTFENKAYPGKYASIGKTTAFTTSGKYNSGVGLFVGANSVDTVFAATAHADSAIAFGFYQAIQLPYTVAELKKDLGGSFNLSFGNGIEGAEVFNGNLVPMGKSLFATPKTDDADSTYYRLQSGEKFVVLNTKSIWAGNVGNEDLKRGAKFELVEKADVDNADYLSYFKISHTAGNDADQNLQVEVLNADQTAVYGRMFVVSAGENKYLTTSNDKADNETWVSVLKGASNLLDVKELLGKFWNISFVSTIKDEAKPYKQNGVLAASRDAGNATNVADYVAASSVLLSSPETQWAVVSVSEDGFTLQNRETDVKVQNVKLRMTSTPNVYAVETVSSSEATGNNIKNDLIKLTEVKDINKFDGFMRTEINTLRNQVFNIGQYHNETGNAVAYWTENHDGNHKLGVSTENATDWKLYLGMKKDDQENEVDTVLVVTKLAKLVDGVIKNEATPDTLAILPYLVQNNSNLEYVLYKGNKLNHYACDEDKDKASYAQRFALKMKPNGTYNVVTIADQPGTYAKTTALGTSKVFVANSEQWGSLDNLNTYSKDNNSLMVVEEVDKPEYRKVAKEWGDVVKIYREEYPTEALFEKRDAKSVVDGETLSFLNVNNSVSGANPALFIDTAYVNRVDANGVANTCYQYLLAVNVDKENTTFCPFDPEHNTADWQEANGGPCPHAKANPAVVKGRFLINLIDTANVYGATHLHNNPYVNGIEAGEQAAKLSFVDGYHSQDTLYITRKGGEVVKLAMDSPEFNVAKFAFRYVDNAAGSFKIQTRFKLYNPEATQEDIDNRATNNGYLKWINGTVVVTNSFMYGETFNMEENYDGKAVANEDLEASSISVVATNGAVIIKGAAGKKVTISNVLGQTVASTVISSDNATISVPAGIVFVAVEGEAAVKAIVK